MLPAELAQHDQLEAACAQVRSYVANITANPPRGAQMSRGDNIVARALMNRIADDTRAGEMLACCQLAKSPRPLYWVPRVRTMFCEMHWAATAICHCFEECDTCRMPIEEAMCVYLFLGPYIIQAMLCESCSERVRLSPTGG